MSQALTSEDAQPMRNNVLLVTTLSSFLAPFMASSVNLAIPAIASEFKASVVVLNWVVVSYLLSSAVFLLPFGRLADISGRKRVFVAGMYTYTASSLMCAFAPSVAGLIGFRGLQGIGGSMMFATGVAILTAAYPPAERGRVLGVNTAAVYAGLSLGPTAGGILTHYVSWRSIFLVNAVLGAFVIWAASKLAEDVTGDSREHFDLSGAVVYTFGMAAVIYGASSITTWHLARWVLFLGLIGIAAFIYQELRTDCPLFDVRLFGRNLGFALSNLAALIHYSATFSTGFLMSLYFQTVRGLDAQLAGVILLSQPAVQALLSPFAGCLSDRTEPRLVASIGMGLTALGLFVFSRLSPATPMALVMTTLVVMGIGFALFSSPNTNAVMSSVERRHYGIASSSLGTMRITGQAFSMAIVTLLFALHLGRSELSPEVVPSLMRSTGASFMLFGFLCLAGILASLARGKVLTQNADKY